MIHDEIKKRLDDIEYAWAPIKPPRYINCVRKEEIAWLIAQLREALANQEHVETLKEERNLAEQKWGDYQVEIIKIAKERDDYREALKFYAESILAHEGKPGDRIEFGCGCCGVINEQDENDYDREVIGLTAREVLAKYPQKNN